MIKEVKLAISSILGLAVTFMGDTTPFVKAVFMLVVIDIITGMIAAKYFRKQDLTTKKFVRKVRELGLFGVGLAAFIIANDAFLQVGLASGWAAKFFCSTYMFYELFSILENLGDMGFPIAKQIKQALKAKLPKELQGGNERPSGEEIKND